MKTRYAILTPLDGPMTLGLDVQPFLTRGHIEVDCRRGSPAWLPVLDGGLYLDPHSTHAFVVQSRATQISIDAVGVLGIEVYGPLAWSRLRRYGEAPLVFTEPDPSVLGDCITQAVGIDLVPRTMRRALERREPFRLTQSQAILTLMAAVDEVGRRNARLLAPETRPRPAGGHLRLTSPVLTVSMTKAWHLRRIIGHVTPV